MAITVASLANECEQLIESSLCNGGVPLSLATSSVLRCPGCLHCYQLLTLSSHSTPGVVLAGQIRDGRCSREGMQRPTP